ncbi:MAG: HD domain-containing protein [Acidaminococcaceae bacterium]|nr:HD domain-containing protein [Acidaminococcaceae bacterium]MBR1512585.1 HD domain-containing protein [Acidaminococcaceae bacterium]
MLENIKAGERICQAVLLRLQKVGNSSNGGVFARGTAEDNSGKIQFIAFEKDIVNRLRELDGPKAFIVSGPVDIVKYSSTLALQVVIQKLDNIMPEDDISNLVPTGAFDLEIYRKKLENLINGVKTPTLRTLLKKIFSGKFYDDFCKNPAGTKLHHAYLGGLLQHSVDVTELAVSMADTIGNADKDLVTAGALLHDIGKVREISAGMGFPYTTEGRLMGHITMSALMVREAALELKLPVSSLNQLEHVILSHHGDQEKGSPVACATKEAFIVHYADEIDAVMNQFAVKDAKSPWEFNNMMKRYLLIK